MLNGAKMKIFIIEDEKVIQHELVQLLERYGYECQWSDCFENIVEITLNYNPDLILLDINLPYMDGFQVCREIRKCSNIPIIILTSRNTDFDEIMSLNIGADDFISKPYNSQILLARIQGMLKRTYEKQKSVYVEHRGLILDLSSATISYNGQSTGLTKNEFNIIRLLIMNKGKIIPRDAIIEELWQDEQFIDENTLNVNILRLRKKLSNLGLEDYLITKRGMGYMV